MYTVQSIKLLTTDKQYYGIWGYHSDRCSWYLLESVVRDYC